MLILTRKLGETIRIGEILIKVVQLKRGAGVVKIGIEAPKHIVIERDDIVKPTQTPKAD